MIQKLLLLLYVYLITQKTLADDPIVSKDYPASIRCQRTKGQVAVEKQQADTNYQSCYDYEIDDDGECSLMNPEVYDLNSFTFGNDTIYTVNIPVNPRSLLYPNDKICFFEIGKRKKGFVYQYYFPPLYQQDIEGSLTIDDDGVTAEVTGGLCQDFFEFREKQFDKSIATNKLVTCGNATDPRIQFAVDVASKLTLVFKSNEQKGYNGLTLSILEYMPSANGSKRTKKDIEAPRGLQGAVGDTGEQGARGKPGSIGNPGRDGSKGIKGGTGIPGVVGPVGDMGLPGKSGIPGNIGPAGLKGKSCTCPSFANCIPGSPGKKGAKGLRGVHGDIGPRGFRGQSGIPGPRGLPGDKGRKGEKGTDGVRGLTGPRGDQGLPGLCGRAGPPGPPGLGGCPLPSNDKLSRHIREVGHIFSTITELYNNFGLENQMSADEFYDYIMTKPSIVKSGHLYSDESRVARSTKSSTDCNGISVIPGPVGDQGVPGPPGDNGIQGKPGLPGVDGTSGRAGDPGTSGPQGSKGSRGKRGPRGPKGDKGVIGAPGDTGFCQCYQDKAKAGNITFLQRAGNGIPGKPGARGPHGHKGPPGSVGEKGLPGTIGRKGLKGFKGVNGVPGRTGFYGNPGEKGQRGQQGVQGPTGPPGPPGPPGCVCNNLIILLDKYGFVKSAKIPDSILNDDRNGSKQENTSTEFLFRPNITCIRNDSSAAIIGPKGKQGLPGFSGATGNPGIPGLPGKDGIPGIIGSHGDPGLPGNNGERGLQGEIGKKGATGINGIQGLPGKNTTCILGNPSEILFAVECPRGCPNGLDGAIGDKGDTGPKGSTGLKGLRGLSGLPGPRGLAGSPGSPGDEGSVGMPGVKGPPGLRGLPGAIGPVGPPGPPGPRDSCPEYDGVDFDMLLSASKEDINMIKYLINTPNIEVAANMTNREFPLLRTIARLITGGYEFSKSNSIEFENTNLTVYEDTAEGHVKLTLKLFRPALLDVTVQLITVSTTAIEHADYVGGPFRALIPEGEQEVIVTIGITNDKEEEPNEKFNVIIARVGLPINITPKDGRDLAEITIINDDYDCIFNESTYTIDEGDSVSLQLRLTTAINKQVEVIMVYINQDTTTDTDYSVSTRKITFPAEIQKNVQLRLNTTIDSLLESNEIIDVVALLPGDQSSYCRAQVIILDDNKLRVSPSDQAIREGKTLKLKFTLDRPLLTQTDMLVPWRYQYKVYNDDDENMFIDRYLRFSRYLQEILVEIEVKNDNVLERNETFIVTARPPADPKGSRNAIATITIIDDEALTIEFEKAQYTIRRDAIILLRLHGGTAAFDIDFLLHEITGTAIGAEHNPTAAVIDYEKFNKNITIARGGTNHTLLIDTIDDDVVEPPVKYFHIEIDENSLPDGVSVGMIHKIRINFTDDDVSIITLKYEELELTKELYADIRVIITLRSRNTYEEKMEAGKTTLQYPKGNKFPAIEKVHMYVPDSIQDRVVIREEDKDYVMITWVS